jgi:hypothetical protein
MVVENLQLRFVQDLDYDTKIGNLHRFGKLAITSECEINTRFNNETITRELLQNCCWILTFATSNWIVFPYYDLYSNGVLIKTVILPISEPFEFVKSQNIISSWGEQDSIKEFLETVFGQYIKFKDEFGLNHIIEYYVSAIRNRSIEETFLIIAIAFECLCSYISEFASKNSVTLVSGDIENKKIVIEKISNELHLKLTEDSILRIAERVAYDKPGLKVLLRYFLQNSILNITKKTWIYYTSFVIKLFIQV